MRRLLTSIAIAAILMGIFLGNAYLYTNIGYPSAFDRIGSALLYVGILLAVPPGMIWSWLGSVGIVPELRGRESFIQLNPGLWIFCFLFYVLVSYLVAGLWRWYKARRNAKKGAQPTSAGYVATRAAPEK
jgi:membrane protein implicated in regulation of membrane protease activity